MRVYIIIYNSILYDYGNYYRKHFLIPGCGILYPNTKDTNGHCM